MRVRQIADMDVVSDAGAVERLVIVAKDAHRRAVARRLQYQGDQVRFRIVPLAISPSGSEPAALK